MDQEQYASLFDLLEMFAKTKDNSLHNLSAAGIVSVSRRCRDLLEQFEREVAARAKAEFDSARMDYEHIKEEFGDQFDAIEPDMIRRDVHAPKKPVK